MRRWNMNLLMDILALTGSLAKMMNLGYGELVVNIKLCNIKMTAGSGKITR